MRFKGKTAVITGGGSGIGKETARILAEEGASVILVGRRLDKLEAAAKEISGAVVFAADVTNAGSVRDLAAFIEEKGDGLHILINGAGASRHSRIMDTTEEEWDAVQDVNLKSVFLVSKALGAIMTKEAEQETETAGRAVVTIASLSGHKAGAYIPHYSAAKAGAMHFTKALALELGPYGIRANSISPGFIDTPLIEENLKNEKFQKAIQYNTVLKRPGTAVEIANVAAFLASDEASYMTGSDVLADGGWMIK